MLSKYLFSMLFYAFAIGMTFGATAPATFACSDPVNLQVSNLTDSSATLHWDAVPGATLYNIEVEDEQNNPSNFHLEANSITNSYALTGLTPGVLYKFKVRTRCGGVDKSDWSNWHFFTSNGNIGSGGNNGNGNNCGIPVGLNVQNLGPNSVTLNWTAVAGALSYTVEIEREKKNAGPWQMTLTSSVNSLDVTGLDPNTRYKFKVRSNCSPSQHSGWSKRQQFKTPISLQDDASEDREEPSAPSLTPAENMTLRVWPNPVQQAAQVAVNLNAPHTVELRLLNLSGKVVYNASLQAPAGETTLVVPVQSLPAGLYLLQARHAQDVVTVKVIVQQ